MPTWFAALVVAIFAVVAPSAALSGEAHRLQGGAMHLAQATMPDWAEGLKGARTSDATAQPSGSAGSANGTPVAGTPDSGNASGSTPVDSAAAPSAPADDSAKQAAKEAEEKALAAAGGAPLEPVLQPVRRISSLLEDLEKTVERVQDRDDELARVRVEIDKLPPEARSAIDAIKPRLADVKAQIDKLGPAPKEGEPAESSEVAAERQRLNSVASQLDGAIKSAELVSIRSRQLIERVQELRQSIFANQVLKRTEQSPLKPAIWKSVLSELPGAGTELTAIARGWWASAAPRWIEVAAITFISLLIYFGFRHLRRRLMKARMFRPEGSQPPRFFERAAVASWVAPAIAVPAVAASIFFFVGLDSSDLLYLQTGRFMRMLLNGALIIVVVGALARAILQPGRREWRLVNLSDVSARRLYRLTRLSAFVYGIDLVLQDLIKMLYLPFNVSIAQAFIFSLMFAGLLFALARTPLTPRVKAKGETGDSVDAADVSAWRPYWLKLPMALVAVAIAGVSLLGYVALGRFISSQVVLTATAVVAIVLVHLAIRAISGDPNVVGETDPSVNTRLWGARLKLDDAQQRQMDRVVYVTLNLLLAFAAVPLMLAIWGFSTPEIVALVKTAVFGFDIGGIHIAPTRILLAIGLFTFLLFVTRMLQRWLSATVLQPSRIDTGLANSIHTGIGYAGYALATLAAISYGGLDITNLAIVAGALSVGIGFGLQSIVNNFVSGLILLVERPIKVGDWIGVGAYEGHVRRISVRSTEIETFDRSSVIVPNSELISGTVKNRTHRNALGRVDVMVGVSYDSDPEQVKALLERIAQESTMVLNFPAPVVSFDNFAASSLDFTLRAYVADVNRSVATATDLRIRIFKALKDANIEIPFPQQDVHLRDLDFVKATVGRLAAERAARAVAEQIGAKRPDPRGGDEPPPSDERPPRNLRSA
ncbi:MAG: mechanosensitive ion channel family protein [Hyphomicrobiaceae bacterium]|nr:mechanosensitive ion channel family protein [Hyphomicrobiaceae bacterium]